MITMHEPVELTASEFDDYTAMLMDMGFTEDEAVMAVEDYEMGFQWIGQGRENRPENPLTKSPNRCIMEL